MKGYKRQETHLTVAYGKKKKRKFIVHITAKEQTLDSSEIQGASSPDSGLGPCHLWLLCWVHSRYFSKQQDDCQHLQPPGLHLTLLSQFQQKTWD